MGVPTQISRQRRKFTFTDQFQLTWDDFSKVSFRPSHNDQPRDAIVTMKVDMVIESGGSLPVAGAPGKWMLGHVLVYSRLKKSQSKVYKRAIRSASKSQSLLEHERGHVELYERSARGLYHALVRLRSNKQDLDAAAQDLVNEAVKLRRAFIQRGSKVNQSYDASTNAGSNGKKQKKWTAYLLRQKGTNKAMKLK